MARKNRGIGAGLATKLVFAGGLIAVVALNVTGLTARTPDAPRAQPRVIARPAPAPRPAPKPVAPPIDERFVVKRILGLPEPLKHGDYYWDDKDVPAGPLVITVDTAAETISVFRDGYEIGTAAILFGVDEKPTPLGVFPITQKDADHISNIYHVPMPYMLRLTNDGVSIHGSDVEYNAGTSGCIGVPVPFAKLLFAQTKLGDRVIVTRGKRLGLGQAIVRS